MQRTQAYCKVPLKAIQINRAGSRALPTDNLDEPSLLSSAPYSTQYGQAAQYRTHVYYCFSSWDVTDRAGSLWFLWSFKQAAAGEQNRDQRYRLPACRVHSNAWVTVEKLEYGVGLASPVIGNAGCPFSVFCLYTEHRTRKMRLMVGEGDWGDLIGPLGRAVLDGSQHRWKIEVEEATPCIKHGDVEDRR